MKRGDVVLITFPFSDLQGIKVRPALIISSNKYNKKSQDALFMLISSNIKNPRPIDIVIKYNHPDFKMTGLKKDSLVKCDKIVSLLKETAKRHLGHISEELQKSIDLTLADVCGLDYLVPKRCPSDTKITANRSNQT